MVKWDKQSGFERDAIAKMAEEEAKKKKAEEKGKGKGSGKDQMTPRRNKQEQPKRKEQPVQEQPVKEIKVEEQGLTFGPSPAQQKKMKQTAVTNLWKVLTGTEAAATAYSRQQHQESQKLNLHPLLKGNCQTRTKTAKLAKKL